MNMGLSSLPQSKYKYGELNRSLRENKIVTDRFHVLRDPVVDPSLQVVTNGHPLVSVIAENNVQLPEVSIVKEPTLKGSYCLNVDSSVNSLSFLDGVV
jgi:hypothetical protein